MNQAVINFGGDLGYKAGNSARLGEQFADAVQRYEDAREADPCDTTAALNYAHGELKAIAAMAIGALERAELASKDPVDALRREDEETTRGGF